MVLGLALMFAGFGHLGPNRVEFQAQVPNLFKDYADLVVVLSGIVEILLGASLLLLWKYRVIIGILTAAFFVAIFTLIGGLATAVRWMVKHYLSELKPNSGSSLKDSVNRLEIQVQQIMTILMTENVRPKRKAPPKEK